MSIKRKVIISAVSVFFTVTLCGCGYSTGRLLPTRLQTVYVENFRNMIDVDKEVTEASRYTLYRPGLENDITEAVVNRFVFDGNLKIEDKEKADLILNGSLLAYLQDALRYDENDDVEVYRIKIIVDIELIDTETDEQMWEEKGFVGEETYKTTGQFATSEDVARDEAIEDLARRIVERTIEGW